MKHNHANRLLGKALSLLAATALLLAFCAVWAAAAPADNQIPGANPAVGDTPGTTGDGTTGGDTTPGDTSGDVVPPTTSDTTSDTTSNTTSGDVPGTSQTESSDTSSDQTSGDTSSDTSTEEPASAFRIKLQATGDYYADGTVSVTATIEGLDGEQTFTGFFFELAYDPSALTLANKIGTDNVLDCVTKKPGDRWENLTKLTENGKIAVSVGVTEDLTQATKTDGTLELTFRFTVPKTIPETTELTIRDDSVKATTVDLTSRPGTGTKLTLTRTQAPDLSSSVTPPPAGDVGTVFPFLLGTGALLGLFTAVRARRRAH